MGLHVSHGAFDGSCSAFNRLRKEVCRAIGGSFPPHTDVKALDELGLKQYPLSHYDDLTLGEGFASKDRWYVPEYITKEDWPGLYEFLEHADDEGEISPSKCKMVADDLEKIIDRVCGEGDGHILRDGGYVKVLKRFIDGCRRAAAENMPLLFE